KTAQDRAALRSLFELKDLGDAKSVDLYFGPKAPAGQEARWIQTTPGKGWVVYFRIYGPEQSAFAGTWKAGDFEEVQRRAKGQGGSGSGSSVPRSSLPRRDSAMNADNSSDDTVEMPAMGPASQDLWPDTGSARVQVDLAAASHRGHVRSANEDHYLVLRIG